MPPVARSTNVRDDRNKPRTATDCRDTAEPATICSEHLALTQAAKIAPGRPSVNCMWRWCRRGVLARTGERVRLQHIRIGGKILTRRDWLEDFGRRLAEADTAYFEAKDAAAQRLPPRDSRYPSPRRRRPAEPAPSRRACDDVDQELREQGL
jgi:hypothetical protein